MGVIFEFPPSTYLNNPMVVTSVVTYTFSIDSFVVSPWSRYGPSVDWGEDGYKGYYHSILWWLVTGHKVTRSRVYYVMQHFAS